jgi:hypothetical protein
LGGALAALAGYDLSARDGSNVLTCRVLVYAVSPPVVAGDPATAAAVHARVGRDNMLRHHHQYDPVPRCDALSAAPAVYQLPCHHLCALGHLAVQPIEPSAKTPPAGKAAAAPTVADFFAQLRLGPLAIANAARAAVGEKLSNLTQRVAVLHFGGRQLQFDPAVMAEDLSALLAASEPPPFVPFSPPLVGPVPLESLLRTVLRSGALPGWSVRYEDATAFLEVSTTGGSGSSGYLLVRTDPMAEGAWHHVAFVRAAGSATWTAYLDGLEATGARSGPGGGADYAPVGDLIVGAWPDGGSAHHFSGLIGPIGVSAAARYSAGFSPPLEPLSDSAARGRWLFDEGAGATAGDSAGTVDLTLAGPSWVSAGPRCP